MELKRQKQTTQPFVGQLTGEQKTQKKMEFDRVCFNMLLLCSYLGRHQELFLSLCRLWVYVSFIFGKCSPSRKMGFIW